MKNQVHHTEQMEAMRAEFSELWNSKILPRLKSTNTSPSEFPKHEDVAWLVFRSAKINQPS